MLKEKETINDRIEQIVNQQFGGNKAAFAKSIGYPPTGMSSYLGKQRRSKPNIDMVTKIVVTLHIDPLWLLTGEEKDTNNVVANGDGSIAVNGNNNKNVVAGNDTALLQERINHLEDIVAEKERLIKVLMEGRK